MEATSPHDELYAYPGRLTWLSMEAFGKFVSTLMKRLVLHNENLLQQSGSLQHIPTIMHPHVSNNESVRKCYILFHIMLVHFQLRKRNGLFNWLTTKALEKYVKTILTKVEETQSNLLQDACEYLRRVLSSVPPIMLHELRIRVLRHAEITYTTLKKTCSVNSRYQEVGTEILNAILGLYPSVTKVEFAISGDEESHLDELNVFKMKSRNLFDAVQPKLTTLKALDIRIDLSGFFGFNLITEPVLYENFSDVEELSCNRLAWKKLNFIIPRCKNLKILHFDAALKPYDVSSILKISQLEELTFRTRYNDRASQLLIGLSRTKRPDGSYISQNMKKLGSIWPSVNDVNLIAKSFTNLSSLSLVSCNCDLSPLKALKNLTHLSVQTTAFRFLADFLAAVGEQLECLELSDIYQLDFNHVVKNCATLSCFHLRHRVPLTTICYDKIMRIPEFPSVESLQLNFPFENAVLETFLSKFPNVKKLDLIRSQITEIPEDLLHTQLRSMKSLEVAYVRCIQGGLMFLVQLTEQHVVITNIKQDELSFYSIPT